MNRLSFILMLVFFTSSLLYSQNYSLFFDGVDNKVVVEDDSVMNPANELTLEAWINASEWNSNIWGGVILSKQGSSPDRGYCLTAGENGRVEFTVAVDDLWKSLSTGQLLGKGIWYHIAGVYTDSTMSLYVNGVLQASMAVSGIQSVGEGVDLNIGENPTWNNRYFHGRIDEVRIWDVARSAEEINDNFGQEFSKKQEGLVGYWKMNEGSGTIVSDSSGNELSGTTVGIDDNDWYGGFELNGKDAGISGVISPYSIGSAFTNNEKVIVSVENYSTDAIGNFEVNYQLNGGEIITETIVDEIPAFSSIQYQFNETIDLLGDANCTIKAYTSLADDVNYSNDTIVQTIEPSDDFMVFDGVQHNFSGAGQSHTQKVYINEDLSAYKQILMHIDLRCPSGGCDPWDQPAAIYLMHNNVKYEIVRYVTPYGKACGDWTYDLTDFKSILGGEVEFLSYIQVWGASGWLLDAKIELVPGIPEYEKSSLQMIWNEDYWVYGDEAVNPHNPAIKNIMVDAETEDLKIRMTTTGHGQANTNNAAEFMEATHHINVNDVETFEQYLWNDDCDQNDCSNQAGTWLYPRAGWCPGQDIQPWEFYFFPGTFTPGEELTLEYSLQDYTNLLNSGYNGGSHTEPHYKIYAYLVSYSGKNLGTQANEFTKENMFNVYPNPAEDEINLILNDPSQAYDLTVYNVSGQIIYTTSLSSLFNSIYTLKLNDFAKGTYIVEIQSATDSFKQKFIKQ